MPHLADIAGVQAPADLRLYRSYVSVPGRTRRLLGSCRARPATSKKDTMSATDCTEAPLRIWALRPQRHTNLLPTPQNVGPRSSG